VAASRRTNTQVSVRSAISDNRPSWHNPRILVLLATIFVCGAAAGAAGARLAWPARSASGWDAGGRAWTLQMMRKELDLTPRQSTEIETVLDEFVLYYQNLQGQMDDFRAEGKQRILRVLTPEQRARFERIMTKNSPRLH
jgi:Spy/CpxP family protein refolding chaperone